MQETVEVLESERHGDILVSSFSFPSLVRPLLLFLLLMTGVGPALPLEEGKLPSGTSSALGW